MRPQADLDPRESGHQVDQAPAATADRERRPPQRDRIQIGNLLIFENDDPHARSYAATGPKLGHASRRSSAASSLVHGRAGRAPGNAARGRGLTATRAGLNSKFPDAGVAEWQTRLDSKSSEGNLVRVQVPPPVLTCVDAHR